MHSHGTKTITHLALPLGALPHWMTLARRRVRHLSPRLLSARHVLALGVTAALGVGISLASSHALRHSLALLLANVCIVGGVIAAPIVSVLAWIGMVLPEQSILHHAANVLFAVALVWLALAIVGAHAQASERHP